MSYKKTLICFLLFIPFGVFADGTTTVIQGDVAFVEIKNECKKTSIKIPKLGTFPIITFQKSNLLIIPIDISNATGTFRIPSCGDDNERDLLVSSRLKDVKIFVIPKDKGGDTVKNANKIKREIGNDARIFDKIISNKKQLWLNPFIFPVKQPVITDVYGYTRSLQGVGVTHKGTDFKADIGTPVYSMNRGIVRYIGNLPSYGKTIIIDHGQGVQTVYLHLSKIFVKKGTIIESGKLIANSGNTGFVDGAHLHISIRVLGISIDPESFMKVLGEKK